MKSFERESDLKQLVETDTRIFGHHSSRIDLTLSNTKDIDTVKVGNDLISDHFPIELIKKSINQHYLNQNGLLAVNIRNLIITLPTQYTDNPKKNWEVINESLGNLKNNDTDAVLVDSENNETDFDNCANYMNEFFCSIGQSERSKQDIMILYCENEVIDNFCGETFEFF